MKRSFLAIVLPLLLAGCGDPDETRATAEGDPEDQSESAAAEQRPDVVDRSETPSEESDLKGVPLEPAIKDVKRNPAYVGVWAPDLSWCENQAGAEVPIQITAGTFGGYENSCEITQIDETGRQEWGAQVACTGDGGTESRRITLAVEGNRMDIVYHEIDDQRISYYRCVPQRNEPEVDDAQSEPEEAPPS